jgi:RNA polymerase sigma factor (sigma-70 family)
MTSREPDTRAEKIRDDKILVRRILDGNLPAWHEFVESYSGTIYAVAGKFFEDEDTVGDVYVAVLDALYRGRLRKYSGRSRLDHWVAVVTRNLCRDTYRRLYGRQRDIKLQESLTPFESHLFRIYYQEGQGLREAYEIARERSGEDVSFSSVFPILARIEEKLGSRRLARLVERSQTRGRVVYWEELENLRGEDEDADEPSSGPAPEERELPFEPGPAREALFAILQGLPEEDRLLLKMRYQHGLGDEELARVLGLESPEALQARHGAILDRLREALEKAGVVRYRYEEIFRALF